MPRRRPTAPTHSHPGRTKTLRATLDREQHARLNIHVLLEEKQKLNDEYSTLYEVYGKNGRELMKARVAQLEARLDALNGQITAADALLPFPKEQTEAVIQSVRHQCAELIPVLGDRSSASLRRLLQVFVPRMTFDVETKEVEIELALPTWALSQEQRILGDVRVASDVVDGRGRHTQCDEDGVLLGVFSCSHEYVKRQPCLSCRRAVAA